MDFPAYCDAVEEELYGNWDLPEAELPAIRKHRRRTLITRHRRGQTVRETADEIARRMKLIPLPKDWTPDAE